MAKREYIQRHLLIIKRLKNRPSSFEDLHAYLLRQQELTNENYDISQRTFQRDLKDIYTIFGIEIKFNKSEGKYEITIYTSCCNAAKGIYYYTTYNNHQISAVDMHRENLDGTELIRYPLITEQQINFQN